MSSPILEMRGMKTRHVVLAITGASGAVYGLRLVEELLRSGARVTLLMSAAGQLQVSQVVDPLKTARFALGKDVLAQLGGPLV